MACAATNGQDGQDGCKQHIIVVDRDYDWGYWK